MMRERGDIRRSLAKRRHTDLDDAKPVIQIRAEIARCNQVLEIPVRRGDDARLRSFGTFGANRIVLALLQHTEQLRLEFRRGVPDLVEKNGAPAGELESSSARAERAGERNFHVAKQLPLEKRRRQRGAIERDERLRRLGGVVVNGPRDQFLSRPALAADAQRSAKLRAL